jgi:hypothetical protein
MGFKDKMRSLFSAVNPDNHPFYAKSEEKTTGINHALRQGLMDVLEVKKAMDEHRRVHSVDEKFFALAEELIKDLSNNVNVQKVNIPKNRFITDSERIQLLEKSKTLWKKKIHSSE